METLIGILTSTYQITSAAVFAYAPRLAATLVVVIGGLIVTRAAKAAVVAILEALKVDDLASRVGASAALKRAHVGMSTSEIVVKLVYWTFLVFTTMVALTSLGIADANMFKSLGEIVPNVILSSAILAFGLNLSAFVSKLIQAIAVNAEIRQARLARNVVHYGMGTLVVVLALRQLGLPDALLSQGVMILFASTGAAMALAFGLGGRDLAHDVATSAWNHEREQALALAEASKLGREVIPGVPQAAATQHAARAPRGRAAATTP